jgi:glycosyltransferase involved in cell wall biosynthesis
MPAVSVILPLYNRAASIDRAVRSVLDQRFADFELIVVDDGSTDRSADIVSAIDDPRLRLVRQPRNLGGNAARNRGIRESEGAILAFLDSDDYFLPDKLGFTVAYFERRPEIDVLLDSFVKSYPGQPGRPDAAMRNPELDDNRLILEALFNRTLKKATPGIAVRRETALRAGLFDEALRRRQDFDFILRLLKVARCASTDQPLWVKANSPDAISANLGGFVDSTIAFYRRHPALLDGPAGRDGLAQDLARHFGRLALRAPGGAWRDARALAAEYGRGRLLRLTYEGAFHLNRRRARER